MVAANFNFLPNKLNFCCGNYSREETDQGRKLYEEIWYLKNRGSQIRQKNGRSRSQKFLLQTDPGKLQIYIYP